MEKKWNKKMLPHEAVRKKKCNDAAFQRAKMKKKKT